ncbi:4-hydroxyphenylacetate 3-hydroxylase family protein [Paenibacillus urinalis]|uniref:4-hydroxyphenylacetate 3-hydroxylase N-terminal domain-containing protein n=1 Tax=Paenibacillus urinalis TaxID=521520 RepID=A0AAX3MU61_9BACL|nr:4-hydroxyphenylacetate 3-hydroxylase N-terminal domain-containing protein [Paenibacillus urinalis]WDH81156.1 4-hydroxyphenylacetate 3-hydroxylase N-terminal domain-containing protein [Paenibacillus urinalis]
MPIKNGKQYIERIDRQNINLWYKGERVTGPLSKHPIFSGLIETQAKLYDMQCDDKYKDQMTYLSPDTGERVGLSYLPPSSLEDLQKRRKMIELWSREHHGFLGRSPDYMNTAMMSFYTAAHTLEEHNPAFAQNLRDYYAYCRDHDITLSHAFIQPPASKWSGQIDPFEDSIAAKVEEITEEGYIVSGAFMMATQGATCDEMIVFPTPSLTPDEEVNPYAFAFAVPNDLEGMTFICRESHASESSYDHPLSSRFEEMDTLVIFDKVLVPHNRMFYYGDETMGFKLFQEGHFHTHIGHQIISRYIAKTEFLLGLFEALADEQNVGLESLSIANVAKIMTMLENFKALRLASETSAELDEQGILIPSSSPLLAASIQFPPFYLEVINMLQLLGSSGIIMTPMNNDISSELSPYVNQYLKGLTTEAKDRIAIFRLVWELTAGPFGGRQGQFERFFFGSAQTVHIRMYNSYDNHEDYRQLVQSFLAQQDT